MSMYVIDAVNIWIHAPHFVSLKIESWIEFYRKSKNFTSSKYFLDTNNII